MAVDRSSGAVYVSPFRAPCVDSERAREKFAVVDVEVVGLAFFGLADQLELPG
ncbi:hypothetical protein PC116_g6877 [Phytophthora cactorum]|uniref:Uncharacterized protein n=1 Tax=Phytophthora cactorum TaxID=29920 RepID=A0A8T1E633_9STRA|nr:hypothetical protein PC114_g5052 [Phytophthora cactorum]KAG2949813.1 hypothetical protein PC117_g4934 [Phytophthora cactorum]KAG2993274.1 hypothetical protein PC118_g4105 [Phytophthora cactorum]KAG3015240.1 hypothetical protein PC119_g11852 [Phytophthora cactorum]KAG3181252.1 hypothetical protein C6341_g6499 [Phytophthora cactorum]